jgi:hypothetical protein
MTDKVFKNLGVFLETKEQVYGENVKVVVCYKQPNSPTPDKIWEHGAYDKVLGSEKIDKILALKKGDKFCAWVGKDESGKFPELKDVTDPKDAEKAEVTKRSYSGGNSSSKPKDETGIAVGAAWTNAIEIIKLVGTNETNHQLVAQDVAKLVEEVLRLKLAQEDRLRAYKLAKQEVAEKKEEAAKPKSLLEKRKEELSAKKKPEPKEEELPDPRQDDIDNNLDDDLDDISF